MTSIQKESKSKCVRIHPKNSVCIGCPGAYEEYLASETTENVEWTPNLSPKQEWRLHNGEEEVPEWFIRWSERVYHSAVSNREKEIAEEVKKLYSLDYMKGSPASYINRALDKVLQIIKH